ncbi:MAG: hypothetical protein HY808_03560 [Nitrospirae bacterium]|nr:hypothetical protein [Nitrospirota bacterium]
MSPGTGIWSKGDKYEGEWSNGFPEGLGTMRWKNGYKDWGTWKQGNLK